MTWYSTGTILSAGRLPYVLLSIIYYIIMCEYYFYNNSQLASSAEVYCRQVLSGTGLRGIRQKGEQRTGSSGIRQLATLALSPPAATPFL
jgi:hypothetical protein